MKKLLSLLAFGLLLSVIGPKGAYAAGVPLPAKAVYSLGFTSAVSTMTVGHSCIYQVILGTGAASEFVAVIDSAPVVSANTAQTTTGLKARIVFGSTSANTVYRFDPPLLFANGIQLIDSAATGSSFWSYDYGDCGTN